MRMLTAILILFMSPAVVASNYDVDWPPSNEKGIHTLAITIDGCETLFKIKDKDLKKFTSTDRALDEALQKAIDRANSGCKN